MIEEPADKEDVLEVFREADVDNTGKLEVHELTSIMQRVDAAGGWSNAVVEELLIGMGLSSDGTVDYQEFVEEVFGGSLLPSDVALQAQPSADDPLPAPGASGRGAGGNARLTPSSVFVRIRPLDTDGRSGHTDGEAVSKQLVGWDSTSATVRERGRDTRYEVTGIVPPGMQQEETFRAVAPELLDTFFRNGNVIFFAYGQTGSGKTHTMLGEIESLASADPVPGWGIFPRVVHATLKKIDEWRSHGAQAVLLASAVEFYCGTAFDLNSDPNGKSEVTIDGNANLFGTRSKEITSTRQLKRWIMRMYANRTTAATNMNAASSRSHCAFVLTLHQLTGEDTYMKTTFSLVDMAGSERSSKTGVARATPDEVKAELAQAFAAGAPERISVGVQGFLINFELSFVATEIMRATDRHEKGMPYKAAKEASTSASYYLSACCDGRARLAACVTVSQSPQHGGETWFSLRYAQQLAACRVPLKRIAPQPWDTALADASRAVEEAAETFERWGPTPSPQGAKQYRVFCLQSGAVTHTAETLECLHKLEDRKNGHVAPEELEDGEESVDEWPPPPPTRPKRAAARAINRSALESGKANESFAVFVRVRPLNQRETGASAANCLTITDIDFPRDPPPQRIAVKEGTRSKGSFVFDRVFDHSYTQEAIYEATAKRYVADFLGGTNVTIFAYGQTGTGKTHTIQGPGDDPGIVTRCLQDMFADLPATGKELHYEYVQLYCRDLKDLLVEKQARELRIVERSDGHVFVQHISSYRARSADEVLRALAVGASRRATRAQDMNAVSSRSHAVLMLRLVAPGEEVSSASASMFIVDLAGSERIARSNVTGQGFEEATAINQSLSSLGRVVIALVDGGRNKFVPYNGDHLTMILKAGLGGNSKTALIACVTQSADSLSESLSTLRFAMQASHVKNKVEKKEARDQAREDAAQIEEAANEVRFDTSGMAGVSLGCGNLIVLGDLSAGVDAPLILLLTGFGHTAEFYAPLGQALGSAGFRWLAPNFPGQGGSTGARCSDKPDQVLGGQGPDVVVQLLDWIGVAKAHLVGLDWGALVCVAMLTLHPRRVGRYAIVNQSFKGSDPMKGMGTGGFQVWWQFQMDEGLKRAAGRLKKAPARFYFPSRCEGGKRLTGPVRNISTSTAKLLKTEAVDNYDLDLGALGRDIASAFST